MIEFLKILYWTARLAAVNRQLRRMERQYVEYLRHTGGV